jgi:hypothetical protein
MDKALLVGINTYPGAPLNGCVNDVNDMVKFIRQSCGFTLTSIKLLVNGDATTLAILTNLQWLVKDARPGDRLLFHYSGHGAQVPTKDRKGEVDGLDEVICPVDFDWSDPHMIRDKQFRAIFGSLPAGVEFVWVSDSCHSGDLSKIMPKPRTLVKSMPVPTHILPDLEKARMLPKKKTIDVPFNGALVSGCRSNQTSADAYFGRRYNGALTYFFLKELQKAPQGKLADVVLKTASALKDKGFSQVPGLEGSPMVESKAFLSKV